MDEMQREFRHILTAQSQVDQRALLHQEQKFEEAIAGFNDKIESYFRPVMGKLEERLQTHLSQEEKLETKLQTLVQSTMVEAVTKQSVDDGADDQQPRMQSKVLWERGAHDDEPLLFVQDFMNEDEHFEQISKIVDPYQRHGRQIRIIASFFDDDRNEHIGIGSFEGRETNADGEDGFSWWRTADILPKANDNLCIENDPSRLHYVISTHPVWLPWTSIIKAQELTPDDLFRARQEEFMGRQIQDSIEKEIQMRNIERDLQKILKNQEISHHNQAIMQNNQATMLNNQDDVLTKIDKLQVMVSDMQKQQKNKFQTSFHPLPEDMVRPSHVKEMEPAVGRSDNNNDKIGGHIVSKFVYRDLENKKVNQKLLDRQVNNTGYIYYWLREVANGDQATLKKLMGPCESLSDFEQVKNILQQAKHKTFFCSVAEE